MTPHRHDNIRICPHCGTENIRPASIWIEGLADDAEPLCINCQKPLEDQQAAEPAGGGKAENRRFNFAFFLSTLLLSGLVLYLNRTYDVLTFKHDSGQIVYEALLILFVSFVLARGRIGRNLKYLGIWGGIFLILMVGYSFRHELLRVKDNVTAELMPAKGYRKSLDQISFPASSNGHFYIQAEVNGIPILFLADTGASHIVLSPMDAEKIGIQLDKLHFDRLYETANGTVRGATIRIDNLQVGPIHLKGIGASVNETPMSTSLLGMTFFKRLDGYDVKNDVLTMYWRK